MTTIYNDNSKPQWEFEYESWRALKSVTALLWSLSSSNTKRTQQNRYGKEHKFSHASLNVIKLNLIIINSYAKSCLIMHGLLNT